MSNFDIFRDWRNICLYYNSYYAWPGNIGSIVVGLVIVYSILVFVITVSVGISVALQVFVLVLQHG